MKHSLHSMTIERDETDGTLTEWRIWFRLCPASGDGRHDPIDPGGVEFQAVTPAKTDIGTSAPEEIWEWAEEEFDRRIDEATTIANEDHQDDSPYSSRPGAVRREGGKGNTLLNVVWIPGGERERVLRELWPAGRPEGDILAIVNAIPESRPTTRMMIARKASDLRLYRPWGKGVHGERAWLRARTWPAIPGEDV